MKKIFFAVFALAFQFAIAQTKTEWKEKDQFHTVMSQTFHPMEEGNYKAIRERSGEMLTKALAWQKSTIPADFKNVKDIKKNLAKLVEEAGELDKKIKANCTDADIKQKLTEMHDIFHKIVGLCKSETTDVYKCPMDCEHGKTYPKPGKCSVCGMDLKKQ